MSCSENQSTTKYVKFINNKPSVTKGSDTIMSFIEGCLTPFFQVITDYTVRTITLGATGGTALINEDMNFIMLKTAWPSTALESEKKLELQLSDFDYTIGGTGPLGATGQSAEKLPFKDLFMINSVENHEHLLFTNPSKHEVVISVLTAKS
jgi:hypothetical protein